MSKKNCRSTPNILGPSKRKVNVKKPKIKEYYVDKILDKKIVNGDILYLVKWLDYDACSSTWEPMKNMNCDELIAEFESSLQQVKKKSGKKLVDQSNASSIEPKNNNICHIEIEENILTNYLGIDFKPLRVKCIIGAKLFDNETYFLIKWKNSDKPSLIPSRIANIRYPQEVISFYESRLKFEES